MRAIKPRNDSSRSGFTEGQARAMLRMSWKGYRIAKVQDDEPRMKVYANKIRKIQSELQITLADFPHLGIQGPMILQQKQ